MTMIPTTAAIAMTVMGLICIAQPVFALVIVDETCR